MSISSKRYRELREITASAGSVLREMLIDEFSADIREVEGADIFTTPWGQRFIDAYVEAAETMAGGVLSGRGEPVLLVPVQEDMTAQLPVLASPAVATGIVEKIRAYRLHLRNTHAEGVAGGLQAFERSWRLFIDSSPPVPREFAAGVGDTRADYGVNGGRIPDKPHWANAAPGTFGYHYSMVHRSLMTQPTMDIIYIEQLLAAVDALEIKDVDRKLGIELDRAYLKLVTIASELCAYALENGALASLQVERMQRRIFDREKTGIGVARVHLNMTSANNLDHGGNLGNIFLEDVRHFLSEVFPRGHVIQSPERTTFQTLLLPEMGAEEPFDNFGFEIRNRMAVTNGSKREKDRADPEAISRFQPRAVVAAMTFGRKNILRYAIQSAEDVDIFRDVLVAMGHSNEVLDAIKMVMQKDGGREEVFGYLAVDEEAQSGRQFNVEAVLARNDRRLNRMLQALMLKAIYHFSRELAGTATYFEKERGGPTDPVTVFTEEDIPTEETDDYKTWRSYADAGVGFVSQGIYDPLLAHPELDDSEFLASMPHMRFLQERMASIGKPEDEIDRILRIFSRPSHDIGMLSHAAREPLKEEFYGKIGAAFNKLLEAENWNQRGPARDEYYEAMRIVNWDRLPAQFKKSLLNIMHATISLRNEGGAKGAIRERFEKTLRDLRGVASPGGALERVQKSIARLNHEQSAWALDDLKRELRNFFVLAGRVYAKAITDPRYSWAYKSSRDFNTGTRVINVDMFSQELARAGWTNIAVFENDSFKSLMARLAPETKKDYNDAIFQAVRDIVFVVAHRWNMDAPLMTPFGGDLNIIAFPDMDKEGLPIDPGAFLAECLRTAGELYNVDYSDTKKVDVQMAAVDFSRSPTREEIDRASAAVADRLGMQTVPSIARNKRGVYVLSVPEKDGFNPAATVAQVAAAFISEGLPLSNLTMMNTNETARVPIWEEDYKGGTRYRFGHVRPLNARPFMKRFSLSAALGRIESWDTQNYPGLAMELSDQVEELKNRFFPHKGGLGFHLSARIGIDVFGETIEGQFAAFRAHAARLDASVLKRIETVVTALNGLILEGGDTAGFIGERMVMRGFAETLRGKACQLLAFNKAFERRVVESFGPINEIVKKWKGAGRTMQELTSLFSDRHAAADRLFAVAGGLGRIFPPEGNLPESREIENDILEIIKALRDFRIIAGLLGDGGGESAPERASGSRTPGGGDTFLEWAGPQTDSGMPRWGEATASAALTGAVYYPATDVSSAGLMSGMGTFAAGLMSASLPLAMPLV